MPEEPQTTFRPIRKLLVANRSEIAIRVIVRWVLTASSRQRCSTASSRSGLVSSFLRGWRSIPGTTPPTSHLDWLSSTMAMIVLFWLQGDEGSAQVVRLGHRGTPSVTCSDEVATSSPPAP